MPIPFCLALAFASMAGASELLVNGSFATSADGWKIDRSVEQDIAFWTSAVGTPPRHDGTSGGSLNLTAFANSSISATQCVAVDAGLVDASVLVFAFVTAGPASARLVAFPAAGCTAAALGEVALLAQQAADGGWIAFAAAGQPLPAGTRSARFEITVANGANASTGDYLFDDARLQRASVFADGFEGDPTQQAGNAPNAR